MFDLAGLPLGIGSMPHPDAPAACDFILDTFPDSPFWPELPKRDWRESMGVEQSRLLPGLVIDGAGERIFIDSKKDTAFELETFYQAYLNDESEQFSVDASYLSGFSQMINSIKRRGHKARVLKGQLTGPTTLGLMIKDDHGRAALYDDQLMDVIVKLTAMKAAWMVARMGEVCDQAIMFFDEPMLQSIGSASIQINRDLAVARLKEATEKSRAISGGHCCGNTDWSILIEAGLDIVALDAWEFGESLALYPEAVGELINREGYIAWGVVPATREGARAENSAIVDKLEKAITHVAQKCDISRSRILAHSLVTPSCGLGSLTQAESESILLKTAEISEDLKRLLA